MTTPLLHGHRNYGCRGLSTLITLGLIIFTWFALCAEALEAKWFPNETDDSGPLPLSSRQRRQLSELDDTIRQSPYPDKTLRQIAEANGMSNEQLSILLQRNRHDLEASRGVRVPPLQHTNMLIELCVSIVGLGKRTYQKHPLLFLLTAVITLIYRLWLLPESQLTGLVLSSRSHLFSKGPTTFWVPPCSFLQRKLEECLANIVDPDQVRHWTLQLEEMLSKITSREGYEMDRTYWAQSSRQSVASALTSLDARAMISDGTNMDEVNLALDIILEQASLLLADRKVSEYCNPHVRIMPQQDRGILVVAGMGDWHRYGLQPLQVTTEDLDWDSSDRLDDCGGEERLILTWSTLPHGCWNGLLEIVVERINTSKAQIRVSLLSTGERSLGKTQSLYIVEELCQSLEKSLRMRTCQVLARHGQSKKFHGTAGAKASHRRHSRFYKEKALEELASDRRRRWQRKYPNAGTYRPSGSRLQSPNNAVY